MITSSTELRNQYIQAPLPRFICIYRRLCLGLHINTGAPALVYLYTGAPASVYSYTGARPSNFALKLSNRIYIVSAGLYELVAPLPTPYIVNLSMLKLMICKCVQD